MRLSISSSRTNALLFLFAVVMSLLGLEIYARKVVQYEDPTASSVALLLQGSGQGGVFGDSQVGLTSFLETYNFYGTAGQQPEELERIVRYHVGRKRLRMAIVEASPQWFGEYHLDRKPMITSRTMPPPWLPFDVYLLSDAYYQRLADSLVQNTRHAVLAAIRMVGPSEAHAQERPTVNDVGRIAAEWATAISDGGGSQSYQWNKFPPEKRTVLTASRVFEQNPREHFEFSSSAAAFRRAINVLLEAGVEVCLFRTPVTSAYENLASKIPNTRYALFRAFIDDFARENKIRMVHYTELGYSFDDSRFINQDHLNYVSLAQVWPLVEKACFSSPTERGQ